MQKTPNQRTIYAAITITTTQTIRKTPKIYKANIRITAEAIMKQH